MIDVKQTVKNAMDFVNNIYTQEKFDRITLEKAELSDDAKYWFVTLGLGKVVADDPFSQIMSGKTKISFKYKIFKIARDGGDVLSMKIRET
jgi:hypothetical protein